jgi:hypothetical protein
MPSIGQQKAIRNANSFRGMTIGAPSRRFCANLLQICRRFEGASLAEKNEIFEGAEIFDSFVRRDSRAAARRRA